MSCGQVLRIKFGHLVLCFVLGPEQDLKRLPCGDAELTAAKQPLRRSMHIVVISATGSQMSIPLHPFVHRQSAVFDCHAQDPYRSDRQKTRDPRNRLRCSQLPARANPEFSAL